MSVPQKNWLEWSVFAVGLALIVGAAGFLAYEGLSGGEKTPLLAVEHGAARRAGEHFIVPVTVTNDGDETAEAVQVEVALERGGVELERAAFVLEFVPRASSGEGYAVFRSDPAEAERVSARVVGFVTP
ncbi:MAG: hypothetical protein RLZZ387_188 [Chloroflexota bacterium]